VVEHVFDYLAHERYSLHRSSLVCRSWTALGQSRLLASMELNGVSHARDFFGLSADQLAYRTLHQRASQLIQSTTAIGKYARPAFLRRSSFRQLLNCQTQLSLPSFHIARSSEHRSHAPHLLLASRKCTHYASINVMLDTDGQMLYNLLVDTMSQPQFRFLHITNGCQLGQHEFRVLSLTQN